MDAIEAAARAISLHLLDYEDEWERYVGQARAAIAAYLSETGIADYPALVIVDMQN